MARSNEASVSRKSLDAPAPEERRGRQENVIARTRGGTEAQNIPDIR